MQNTKANVMCGSYWPTKETTTVVSANPICETNKIQRK